VRIYTRTGDGGETGLYGGRRVRKDDPRVQAYGGVDELNACLGLARALGLPAEIDGLLGRVQGELLHLGADLARPADAPDGRIPRIGPSHTAALEAAIDAHEDRLPPLRHFILPGGSPGGAALHLCRTVCRRVERDVVRLRAGAPDVNPEAGVYLNRLSDLLFVLARSANAAAGRPEAPWLP
jgi:cob(I)alamin adenosyltransferase